MSCYFLYEYDGMSEDLARAAVCRLCLLLGNRLTRFCDVIGIGVLLESDFGIFVLAVRLVYCSY